MAATWRCPIPGCPEAITETAGMVEALVVAYARGRHGELPEPLVLGQLRHDHVADLLSSHLRSHGQRAITAWLTKIR